MNLPNSITLFRVILIPFFINLMIYGYYRAALAVFIVACITDALDGMIARLMKSKTDLGAFLDPMADKLLIVSAFITLVLLNMLPVWLAIVVISRDVILVFGSIIVYFMQHNFTVQPSRIGKLTTVLQLLCVTLTLVQVDYDLKIGLLHGLQWTTAAVTIASGIQYVSRGMKIAA
jgi:cardiolipin synthase (CMP-forming)